MAGSKRLLSFAKSFSEHPASVDETYLEHLIYASKLSARIFVAAVAAFIHALVPALFETTASQQITAIYCELQNRKH